MSDKITERIFVIAMAIGCLLFFGGIGYMIYDFSMKVALPIWVVMIAEGMYVFSLVGIFLDVVSPHPIDDGNYYERKLL